MAHIAGALVAVVAGSSVEVAVQVAAERSYLLR